MDKVTSAKIVIALWASYAGLSNDLGLPFWGQWEDPETGDEEVSPPAMRDEVLRCLVAQHGVPADKGDVLMTEVLALRSRDPRRDLRMKGPFLARWRDDLAG